jgi:hypothetical protein
MVKRKAFRKQVALENVVAIIDERLVLTVEQREQLTKSLDKNWQDSWVNSVELLLNNNQYLPSIPDQFVVAALNDTQRQIWRAAPKQNFMVFGAHGWGQQVAVVDDFPIGDVEAALEATSEN